MKERVIMPTGCRIQGTLNLTTRSRSYLQQLMGLIIDQVIAIYYASRLHVDPITVPLPLLLAKQVTL